MRFLLTGANGQLATDIQRVLPADEVVPVTHEQLDICDGPW
jgi:dTDP-4-dehydrorhamnose reductase